VFARPYVKSLPSCSKDDNLVPYLRIHYCTFGAVPVLSIFFQLGLVALFFYVLATVAERFFCPALENVSAAEAYTRPLFGST
jgi:sodium/potassium/calcium exchanger 6